MTKDELIKRSGGRLHRWNFVQRIRHDGEPIKKNLYFYTEDFGVSVRKKAKIGRVINTNHAYLLSFRGDDPSLVENRTLVVDEAHKKLYFSWSSFQGLPLSLSDFMLDLQRG